MSKTPIYQDCINGFWKAHEEKSFTPYEITLFFVLLHEAHRQRWKFPFEFPTKRLLLFSGLSESTFSRAREALMQRGVVGYEKGSRRTEAPRYYLLCGGKKDSFTPSFTPREKVKEKAKQSVITPREKVKTSRHLNEKINNILNINKQDITTSTTARAYAREEKADEYEGFLDEFFSEARKASVEQACMSLKISEGQFRECAEQIVSEWRLTDHRHRDYNDRSRHLISQTRIKVRKESQTNEQNRERERIRADRRGTAADSKKQKNWDASF